MTRNSQPSPPRSRTDLVARLPAVGMFVGAIAGGLGGMAQGVGGPVSMGGLGIGVGLVVGLLLRVAFRPGAVADQ
ncbi:MAG: hypothetical protein ACXWYP_05865 [Pseudonocardia sp.]